MPLVLGAELTAPQGPATGFSGTSVVICEENEGIFVDSVFTQGVEDSAGAGIDLGDQGLL